MRLLSTTHVALAVALTGCADGQCDPASGGCDPTDDLGASDSEAADTDVVDTVPVGETDGAEDTDVVDDDTDVLGETDVADTQVADDTDPPDSPVDTESDVPVDSEVPDASDPPTLTECTAALADYPTVEPDPPTLTDLATLTSFDAYQCADDPARATTCPRFSGTCTDALGRTLTFVRLGGDTTYGYGFYDDVGTLLGLYLHTDAPEYCGLTSTSEWFGERIVACAGAILPFDQPECGVPLTCTSPP